LLLKIHVSAACHAFAMLFGIENPAKIAYLLIPTSGGMGHPMPNNGMHQPLSVLLSFSSLLIVGLNGRPLLPNYLVEQDFANAIFVKANRPPKLLHNDQRFHKVQRYCN
jgi:hypothetical protein